MTDLRIDGKLVSKTERVEAIKRSLARQGKRLTNLTKADINKLDECITKFGVDLEKEVREIREQKENRKKEDKERKEKHELEMEEVRKISQIEYQEKLMAHRMFKSMHRITRSKIIYDLAKAYAETENVYIRIKKQRQHNGISNAVEQANKTYNKYGIYIDSDLLLSREEELIDKTPEDFFEKAIKDAEEKPEYIHNYYKLHANSMLYQYQTEKEDGDWLIVV